MMKVDVSEMAQCPRPIVVRKIRSEKISLANSMEVPCGYCFTCRKNRALDWTLRLKHEAEFWPQRCFITLTYTDDELMLFGDETGCMVASLVPKHVTDFLKRFRRKLEPNKIKYFLRGEYGRKTGRPHYHLIVYGWRPDDRRDNIAADCWPYGHIDVGACTPESIAYTTGYVIDKLRRDLSLQSFQYPEYNRMSRGLGLRYATMISDDIKSLSMTDDGRPVNVPRYYRDKIGVDKSVMDAHMARHQRNLSKHYGGNLIERHDLLFGKSYIHDLKTSRAIERAKVQHEQNVMTKHKLKDPDDFIF